MTTEQFPNGSFALVGHNPCEEVWVRADAPDMTGLWYPLTGKPGNPKRWASVVEADPVSAVPPRVVRLFTPAQAAEEMLRFLEGEYLRQRTEARQPANGSVRRQRSQAALGTRTAAEVFARRYGLPTPEWGEPPAEVLAEPTQPMCAVEPVTAVPVTAVTGTAPAPAARRGLRRLLGWPTNTGRPGGRHRDEGGRAGAGRPGRRLDDTGQHDEVMVT